MEKKLQYFALSFSHKKTPIELRERLAFADNAEIYLFLQQIKQLENIEEVILLSTCNRVELYCYAHTFEETKNFILKNLSQTKKIDLALLNQSVEIHEHIEAIHYIFCVASSLESVVVGETQIAGQLKDAYKACFDAGFCSKAFTRLIHFAFRCAAKVRNHTQISGNATSVASVAIHQAKSLQKQYGFDRKALVIGMGEMGILSAKYLLDDDYDVMICNRNQQRIQDFISQCDIKQKQKISICEFEHLQEKINAYPLLFSATGASEPIILKNMIKSVDFKRFWFDLAIPRDIEHFEDEKIELFVVDDLKQVAQENLNLRKESLHKAYEIVGIATMEFSQWLQTLDVEPLIKKIREMAKEASLREINRAVKKGYIPKEYQHNVEKVVHQAFNVFLHKPTQNLRDQVNKQEIDIIIESIKNFFSIDKDSLLINTYKCEYDTSKSE